jgi:uncharacterized protein (DUF2062 family)
LRGNSQFIARGFAVGTFAGCFPLFGLQMIIAVVLATLFRGNKIAAASATWISNPLTSVPIFLFNFKVGKFLLNSVFDSPSETTIKFNWQSWQSLFSEGLEVIITLFFGCFVVGLIASFLVYFLSLNLFKKWQNKPK